MLTTRRPAEGCGGRQVEARVIEFSSFRVLVGWSSRTHAPGKFSAAGTAIFSFSPKSK